MLLLLELPQTNLISATITSNMDTGAERKAKNQLSSWLNQNQNRKHETDKNSKYEKEKLANVMMMMLAFTYPKQNSIEPGTILKHHWIAFNFFFFFFFSFLLSHLKASNLLKLSKLALGVARGFFNKAIFLIGEVAGR